jgi:hypothetical protein
MAYFYGKLQGSRGETTRCGTKSSGMETVVASWQGSVVVRLHRDESRDQDIATVRLNSWEGGKGINKILFQGPVSGEDWKKPCLPERPPLITDP